MKLIHFIMDFWDFRSIQDLWKLTAILFQILQSGNHAKISEYRQFYSIEKTMKNRMDLFEKKLENIDEDLEFKKVYKKYLKNK